MRETTFLANDQTTMLNSAPRGTDQVHVARHPFTSAEAHHNRSGDIEVFVDDERKALEV